MSEANDGIEQTRIEEAMKRLSPQEAAVFRLLLHLRELEKKPQDPSVPHTMLSFEYGRTAERIIQDVLNGDTYSLPIRQGQGYGVFGWLIAYPQNLEEKKRLRYDEYKKKYPTKGSNDIRIYNYTESTPRGNVQGLRFFANMGSFIGMEDD